MPRHETRPLLHRRVDLRSMEALDSAPPRPVARIVGRGEHVVDENGKVHEDTPIGSYNIRRTGGNWRKIYWDDLFHTIINTRTSRVIAGVFGAYAIVIFLFALCYRYVSVNDPTCNVGVTTIMEAYIFSVETIMTIGYGAPSNDIFYGGCGSMAVILTLESFSGIFLDAVCIGMFFVRFSRATTRACSIIFSNFAVIRKIRGDYYFMFQVCERRKHQLAEAHVRCYAVRHEFDVSKDGVAEETALFQTHHMRLQQPDDDIGAFLLMALPQVVVHRIDPWSPFFPRECLPSDYHATTCPAFPDPSQRAIDHENGNRDYHADATVPTKPTQAQIDRHLRRSELEVVVILEGTDSTTGNTMQVTALIRLPPTRAWMDVGPVLLHSPRHVVESYIRAVRKSRPRDEWRPHRL
ncbi:hypothetical protein, variant 1 [Aphanomyces invadans]|uniref:Potassium channel inwardly rectifying transmembrane domain-containing protein n=1 Tax=Aphanomyces invadans TaxID=157072 RepID=A0A024TF25_9STRA|nr:hypothetical protein, variant 1 [Aphanomyces invadans]ETV91907.1 hypothetical protein, variant 1 [Aphanomyces invadans]|eukprot:XP_008879545.1 hypothetical protein, variant 1 [Aphanomyces invadans]